MREFRDMTKWFGLALMIAALCASAYALPPDFTDAQKALLARFPHIDWSRWQLIYIDDSIAVAVDTKTVRRLSTQNYTVWLNWLHGKDQPLGYTVQNGNRYYVDYSELRQLTEIRCDRGEEASLQQSLFRLGEFIQQLGPWPKKHWSTPVPQTVGEIVFRDTCTYLRGRYR